jgi:hypothetical protein
MLVAGQSNKRVFQSILLMLFKLIDKSYFKFEGIIYLQVPFFLMPMK